MWYDTMLVCKNGHRLTTTLETDDGPPPRFCAACGTDTISKCEHCGTKIPGYLHNTSIIGLPEIPVPACCRNCGRPFPWSITAEVTAFSDLVRRAEALVTPDRVNSCWVLSRRVQDLLGLRPVSLAARCQVLWPFYHHLLEQYGRARPMSVGDLKRPVVAFASFLREFEQAVRELQEQLGFPFNDPDTVKNYGTFREAYNKLVEDFGAFARGLGLPDYAFEKAMAFSDLPQRSLVDERSFAPGATYDVYKTVKQLVAAAKKEVFVVETYPNEDLFELYLDKVPVGVKIRVLVLAKKYKPPFLKVAGMFTAKAGIAAEVRESSDVHDRTIFIDDHGYVIGQSLKDAATQKPTYLMEITASEWRRIHETLWGASAKIA